MDEFKSCFLEMATVSDFNRRMGIHTCIIRARSRPDVLPERDLRPTPALLQTFAGYLFQSFVLL